jgi:hypothetical protein
MMLIGELVFRAYVCGDEDISHLGDEDISHLMEGRKKSKAWYSR